MPSQKRREENYKFLFKRFFKHIQTKFENSQLPFQSSFESFLAPVFSQIELSEYFKLIKETRQSKDGKRSWRTSVYLPRKLNTEFANRILNNPFLRDELSEYLNCHLRDQLRQEIRRKTLTLTNRFRDLFYQNDDSSFFAAVKKHMNGKPLRFWTLSEVEQVIVDLNQKINSCTKNKSARYI